MRVIREPGYAVFTAEEWAVVLPCLLALGYRWEKRELWKPMGQRCVGQLAADEQPTGFNPAAGNQDRHFHYYVEAKYLVDVLPGLLWPVATGGR